MKIPDELSNLDFETYDAISSLVDPYKKGEIISITALVEEVIVKMICGSNPPSKSLNEKTFSDKIKSLEAHFNKNAKHQSQKTDVLAFARALLAIRNLLAHTYGIGFNHLSTLEQEHPCAKILLANCPANLWEAVKTLNKNLQQISNDPE